MFVMVMMLLVAACGDDTPAAGPVTLRAKINLSDPTVAGTFTVDTGADVLGCSSGTVVQVNNSGLSATNVMTCDSGPNAGTVTITRGGEDVRVWNVLESSDDFAGLQGEGSWDWALTGTGSVVETFTGDIEYTP
jgi:hypothetical protein